MRMTSICANKSQNSESKLNVEMQIVNSLETRLKCAFCWLCFYVRSYLFSECDLMFDHTDRHSFVLLCNAPKHSIIDSESECWIPII